MHIATAARPAVLAALTALLAGCDAGTAESTAPDLRATVAEVVRPDPSRQPVVRVYVDRAPATPGAGARMPITLTGGSAVYVEQGGAERRTDYHALQAGQAIAVWFVEGTDETNPGVRQARKVVIQAGTP